MSTIKKQSAVLIHAPVQSLHLWAEIREIHSGLTAAGRLMVLLGVKCLQLKESIGYGQFGHELTQHCPEISRVSLYRAMKVAVHVMDSLGCDTRDTTGAAAQMAAALEGTGEAELLAGIDALIHGKSGRQLVLEARESAEMDSLQEECRQKCLYHFEHSSRGAQDEAAWRMEAEAGEMTWAQCWQKCGGAESQRNDLRNPMEPKRVKRLLESGIVRLEQWGGQDAWAVLDEQTRVEFTAQWRRGLAGLNYDLRIAALMELSKEGGSK